MPGIILTMRFIVQARFMLVSAGMLLLLHGATAAAGECPLSGTWKSDEAKTLASLHANGQVNDRQRRLFENHFFGQMTMTYSCNSISVRYAGDSESIDYEILRQQGPRITIRTIENDSDEGKTRVLTMDADGRCYSVPVAEFGFQEYFCRIQ